MCREARLGSSGVFSLTRHGLLIYEATAVVITRLPGGCFFNIYLRAPHLSCETWDLCCHM